MNKIKYHDSYWYCYANSTAMLLSSVGVDISPRIIEVLSGVGLGFCISKDSGLPFFSGATAEPDRGISKALDILGFAVFEDTIKENPIETLKDLIKDGPVLIGPLDMSYLVYNPDRPMFQGVDHFVLVTEVQDDFVTVLDPAGYAYVNLDFDNLLLAWKAENISYKRGSFRYWCRPELMEQKSEDEIIKNILDYFKKLIKESEESDVITDSDVIKYMCNEISTKGLSPEWKGHLNSFAFPLAVKRALDFSRFFEKSFPELSDAEFQKAELFGKCVSESIENNFSELIKDLKKIGEIEERIKKMILEKVVFES